MLNMMRYIFARLGYSKTAGCVALLVVLPILPGLMVWAALNALTDSIRNDNRNW